MSRYINKELFTGEMKISQRYIICNQIFDPVTNKWITTWFEEVPCNCNQCPDCGSELTKHDKLWTCHNCNAVCTKMSKGFVKISNQVDYNA